MREFHIHRAAREKYGIQDSMFSLQGRLVLANLAQSRELARRLAADYPDLRHQDLFAMGLIEEINHYIIGLYGKDIRQDPARLLHEHLIKRFGRPRLESCIGAFAENFPPTAVFRGDVQADDYLNAEDQGCSGYAVETEEMLLLWLENQNPAYAMAQELFDDRELEKKHTYSEIIIEARSFFAAMPSFGPDGQNLVEMLRAPALAFPDSLEMQLEYIRTRWGYLLGDMLLKLMRSIDFLKEANAYFLRRGMGGFPKGESAVHDYSSGGVGMEEYERFSPDRDWMPKVVLLAKTTLVWLDQLTRKYGRPINRLDLIPDEELDLIASRGFNSLWLIGLWERSDASRIIKHRCGNPEAAASAYALHDYDIAEEIGGWPALEQLRWRAWHRGIRLASDMVPNHTGIESRWVTEHPDWYVQTSHPPFPGYSYNSENLSSNPDLGIYLEDHYYSQSDAAVTFKRVDFRTGETRYIYHGNDGTHMPWNDTAQLDFTRADVREAIIQTILHVARNFPVIRFDAAMTLAKRHIQRLWFPEPGHAGDIPSRAEYGMTAAEFNKAIPVEFWREVVDRVAQEAPDTLLLAEAFWMMEGYFVRTLGMHRVYNSAFMNMLKAEENAKYRQTIKNTISFDKDILKRFVNFMNNPDEETALAQFGDGDKYFGVCTLMCTMPGLPMFGHGQIEGFGEKYGMEYRRAYKDEQENEGFIARHYHDIFPLLKKRYLFADVDHFYLYDLYRDDGSVNENVFAYTNACGNEHALVVYNNVWEATYGTLKVSSAYLHKGGANDRQTMQRSLADSLGLRNSDNCYLLFRELRSATWYIRRSSEIHRHGLRVILNGYQAQVCLDMHEVHDNELGHYRMLHDSLEGRGVPDIQEALRDLVLKPVFDAFASDLNASFWADGIAFFDPEVAHKAAVMDKLLQRYQNFVARTLDFAQDKVAYRQNAFRFKTGMEALQRALDTIAAVEDRGDAGKDELALIKFLRGGLASDERRITLLALVVVAPLFPENEIWQLQYRVPGLGDHARELGPLADAFYAGLGEKGTALLVDKAVLGSLEVQEYLGVHYYDAVRWYNQERFDDLLWWLPVFRLMAADGKDAKHFAAFAASHGEWLAAHKASEYRYEDLKRAILKLPKRGKAAAKPAGKAKKAGA